MIPVKEFMPEALAAILRAAPLDAAKVSFAWRAAVGPAIGKVTSVRLEGTVLRVHVPQASWQREIERSAVTIRQRLDALLGPRVVRSLDVLVDPRL